MCSQYRVDVDKLLIRSNVTRMDTDLRSQLRHAIANETDELVRCKLEFAVDGLDRAIRDFNLTPHEPQLRVLNWTNALRTLDMAGQNQPKEMA